MGDHRASIKIDMSFHGVKDSCDMWINYDGLSGECHGVDDRVVEFIQSVYDRGIGKYQDDQEAYFSEQTEKEEKEELKRLKAKYEKEKGE